MSLCLLVMPFSAYRFLNGRNYFLEGDVMCILFPLTNYLNVGVSLLSVAAITVNRQVFSFFPSFLTNAQSYQISSYRRVVASTNSIQMQMSSGGRVRMAMASAQRHAIRLAVCHRRREKTPLPVAALSSNFIFMPTNINTSGWPRLASPRLAAQLIFRHNKKETNAAAATAAAARVGSFYGSRLRSRSLPILFSFFFFFLLQRQWLFNIVVDSICHLSWHIARTTTPVEKGNSKPTFYIRRYYLQVPPSVRRATADVGNCNPHLRCRCNWIECTNLTWNPLRTRI